MEHTKYCDRIDILSPIVLIAVIVMKSRDVNILSLLLGSIDFYSDLWRFYHVKKLNI